MKKLVMFLVMALCALVSEASDRTLGAVLNRSDNTVDLTFSGVGERKLLYVAYDAADQGETPSAWAEMDCLGVISNDVTSYTYVLPESRRQRVGALRFFLAPVAASDKYDRRVAWIQKSPACDFKGYVDTGVLPGADLVTRVKWLLPKSGDQINEEALFGVTGECAVFLQAANFFWAYLGKSGTSGSSYGYATVGNVPHVVQVGRSGVFFDEKPLTDALDVGDRPQTETIKTFVRSTGNEKGSRWTRIYWLTMTNDEGPVRSMFPCVKDGKTGLYDEVEGVFHAYVVKSGAQLSAGPEWGADRLADETPDVVSAGVRLAWEVTEVTLANESQLSLTTAGSFGKAVVYLARDVVDKGSVPSDWADIRCAGVIPADTKTFTCDLPAEWLDTVGALRVFLTPVVANPKYDMLTEWIYSPNHDSAYIDSGIVPAPGIAVRTKFMMPSKTRSGGNNVDVGLFGVSGKFAWASQSAITFLSYFTSSPGTFFLSGSGYGTAGGADKPHVLVLDADGVRLDGNKRKVFLENTFQTEAPTPFKVDGTVTTTDTLVIMGRRAEGETTANKAGAVYVYNFDITTNDVPARRYVPCKKGDQAGLYDQVTDEVFFQYGGTAMTAGPEWGPETVADDAVVVSSPVVPLTRTVRITSVDREKNEVTLAFGGISRDALLFAVHDRSGDKGLDAGMWASHVFLGKIAANATGTTCSTLPASWLRGGGTIRFLLTTADEYPYDERLDYIASTADGKPYLDTGVRPTTNTVFAMRLTRVVADYAAWGAVGNSGYAMSAFAHSSDSGVAWCYFGVTGHYRNEGIVKTGQEITYSLRLGMSGLFINDIPDPVEGPFDGRTTFSESDASIYLFARNNKGDPAKHGFVFKIHEAKIWDGTTPIRDFVPCKKDGKVRMYDRVGKRYYDAPNGKAFVASEKTIDPSPAEAPALSWSDSVSIPLSGLMIIVK